MQGRLTCGDHNLRYRYQICQNLSYQFEHCRVVELKELLGVSDLFSTVNNTESDSYLEVSLLVRLPGIGG